MAERTALLRFLSFLGFLLASLLAVGPLCAQEESSASDADTGAEAVPEQGEALNLGFDRAILDEEKAQVADFLTPEPLGFDFDTFSKISSGIELILERVRAELDGFTQASVVDKLKLSAPLQLFILLLALLWFMERRARDLRRELWDMVPPLSTPLLDILVDSTLRLLARVLPVVFILIPAYFPLRGIFPEALWLTLMIRMLWVLLIYRAAQTLAKELLLGELLDLDQKPRRLHHWLSLGLRVLLLLWALREVLLLFPQAEDVVALVSFATRLFLAVYSLRLFSLRTEIVSLMPSSSENGLYNAVREGLVNYIQLIIGLSVLLLILWASGFGQVARFILVRTYALLGALLAGLWLYRKTQEYVRRMIQGQESPEGEPKDVERHRVLRSVESGLTVAYVVVLIWGVLSILGVWDFLTELAKWPLFKPSDKITISVYVVAKSAAILMVFVLASRILKAILNEKVYHRFEVDIGVGYAINTMVQYTLFVMGLLFGLKAIGLDLTAIGIFFSALGIGIGFGLQNIVNNLISGFILLFGRSVKKGDFVSVGGNFGRVDAVGARSVTLTTPDNFELVIPSSEIVSTSFINWTLTSPFVRISIPVGVSYEADVKQVRDVLLKAAVKHSRVMRRPKPEVWLEEFGDNSVNFALLVFIDLRRTTERRVRGELNYHIWDALKEAQVEIPFPQRDLHIRSGFDLEQVALLASRRELSPQAVPLSPTDPLMEEEELSEAHMAELADPGDAEGGPQEPKS